MAHSNQDAAARAVKNSQKVTVETRTPEEIIKTLRNNLTNPLAILKSDVAVLLAQYDIMVECTKNAARLDFDRQTHIASLESKVVGLKALIADVEREA